MKYYFRLLYKGIRNPRKYINNIKNLWRNKFTDVFIVSYPKAGRTWLRVLIGKTICETCQINDNRLLDTYYLTSQVKINRVNYTHCGPLNINNYSHYSKLKFNKKLFKNKKIIFLIRDIRDTLVSSYFQEIKRDKVYNSGISSFILNETMGIKKIIAFYNMWFKNQKEVKEFRLIRYEDIHKNPEAVLRNVMKFIGIDKIDNKIIYQAIEFAAFKNMKKMEERNQFRDQALRSSKTTDKDSFKVRRGKVGGYTDYLSEDNINKIESILKEMSIKECDWYTY